MEIIRIRLSRDQIQQIIAEHMSAKFGGTAEDVEVWPVRGDYGAETFATVTIRNPEVFPWRYGSPMDAAETEIPQQAL
jgi:hypothetical protein